MIVTDAEPRLLKESHKAMGARYSWLFTGLPLLVLMIMLIFGFITFVLEQDGLHSTMSGVPSAVKLLESIFGSIDRFYFVVKGSWYLAVFLHVLEACYVAFKLKARFNLSAIAVSNWFVLVSCVGYPITIKAMEFIKIDDEQRSKKQS